MPENLRLREFKYLDSLSVSSLLASCSIAIPEEYREVAEDIQEEAEGGEIAGEVSLPGVGSVGAGVNLSESKTGRQVLETNKRVNEQYLFNILHEFLEEQEKITKVPDDEGLSLEQGDVVQVTGEAVTDPLYQLFNLQNVLSSLEEMDEGNEDIDEEDIESMKQGLYGDRVSIIIDPEEDNRLYPMTLDYENLWVDDPGLEFTGDRIEYTVLGRVERDISPEEEWDLIHFLRIADTILEDNSTKMLRNVFRGIMNQMDDIEEVEEIEDEAIREQLEQDTAEFSFNVDSKVGITVGGEAIVVEPIAIYR